MTDRPKALTHFKNIIEDVTLCGVRVARFDQSVKTDFIAARVDCNKCLHILNPQDYPDKPENPSGLLSDEELAISQEITELAIKLENILADGESRASHKRDIVFYIHGLQTIVMSQAAARAYPDVFRLLGE